jgi:hypothetical protein
MKRHVALIVLALTAAIVVDLHVDWRRADNGVLMRVGEHDVDVWGHTRQAWTHFTRRCGSVRVVGAGDADWGASLAAIHGYSPPDSLTAQLVGLTRQGDWLLAQVVSDRLMPAVVVLQSQGTGVALVPTGIWSGNTAPWLAAPWIRDYLQRQVPQLPSALADCLDIDPDSPLQRPMPLPAPSRTAP